MQYSLSTLKLSSVRWLAQSISDARVRRDFLTRLADFLKLDDESEAALDLVFCTASELSAKQVLQRLSAAELAGPLVHGHRARVVAFLRGLPSGLRGDIARVVKEMPPGGSFAPTEGRAAILSQPVLRQPLAPEPALVSQRGLSLD